MLVFTSGVARGAQPRGRSSYLACSRTTDPMRERPHVPLRLDALTYKNIYEIKCVDRLTDEHLIQLALYGWLWQRKPNGKEQLCEANNGTRGLRLVNMRSGELRELTSTPQQLEEVAQARATARMRNAAHSLPALLAGWRRTVYQRAPTIHAAHCCIIADLLRRRGASSRKPPLRYRPHNKSDHRAVRFRRQILIEAKLRGNMNVSDEEFLKMCEQQRNKHLPK